MTEEFRDKARLDANAVPEPGREEYLAQLDADERDDEALFGSEDKFIARYGKDWKGNTAPTAKPSPLGNNRPLGDPSAYRHIGSLTPSDADELQKQKTVTMGRSGPKHVVYDTAKGRITMADPEFAELESTKIMDRLHGGSSWRDWSGLVERQKAEKNREINDMLRKRSEFLQKSVADRKKIVAERNFNMADTGRLALDLLNRGEGEVKTDNKTGKRYLYVHVDPSRFEDIARQDAERGRRSSVGGMSAYVQIDDKGNPIGDPRFMLDVKKNNGDGAKDAKSIEPITLSQIMGQWAKSYATAFGASEADAQQAAISNFMLNGRALNPMNWARPVTEAEKFAAQQKNAELERFSKENIAKEQMQGRIREIEAANQSKNQIAAENRTQRKEQFDEKMRLEREKLAARNDMRGRYDSKRAAGMKDWLDNNGEIIPNPKYDENNPIDPNGNEIPERITNPNYDAEQYKQRLAQYYDYIWGNGKEDGDKGGGQQAQRPTREEIQAELARRRVAKAQYGLRNDGKTYKGTGWLGELKLPNGDVATEYTMQSDAVRDANGNRIDFPSLVPTLTKDEVDLMVNDIIPNNKPVPDAIAQKAVDFARDRMSKGQSVFAN